MISKTLSVPTLMPSWVPKINLVAASFLVHPDCQIDSHNDLEAVQAWLFQYKTQPATFKAYQKEVERFLLWCIYQRGSTLSNLKVADFNEYFEFLKAPPSSWCSPKASMRAGRGQGEWRPLLGALTRSSLLFAFRIINSLMNYLVAADYLRTNPLKLIKTYQEPVFNQDLTKYQVLERMLEVDEWSAVQRVLENLPEHDIAAIHHKLRSQFLMALLYLLGLRIHEVANAAWSAFRQIQGRWWFLVQGKGNKLGQIPVNTQLLSMVKTYRLHLKKLPLPTANETEQLFISRKTKKPLGLRQLYEIVKAIGKLEALEFGEDLVKKQKLEKLSPHWLRHLSALHQDQVGITGAIIQASHRHGSFNTTRIYLHAADELRSTEMEKLQMQLQPRMITVANNPSEQVAFKLELVGGPFSEVLGLQHLMMSIENRVLAGITWSKNEASEQLIVKYNQLKNFKIPLQFSYTFTATVTDEQLAQLKKAIIREAEIRLFQCELRVEFYDKTSN